MDLSALPWLDWLTKLGFGAIGAACAYAGRFIFNWFDFLPRRLESLSIGSHFGGFSATAPGDQYQHALFIDISNQGGLPLYVVRAVYIPDGKDLPIYINARRSQKKTRGYELKFGPQWKSLDILLQPHESADTYLPLSNRVADDQVPQGRRGTLYVEYVFSGKTGIHNASL